MCSERGQLQHPEIVAVLWKLTCCTYRDTLSSCRCPVVILAAGGSGGLGPLRSSSCCGFLSRSSFSSWAWKAAISSISSASPVSTARRSNQPKPQLNMLTLLTLHSIPRVQAMACRRVRDVPLGAVPCSSLCSLGSGSRLRVTMLQARTAFSIFRNNSTS